MDFMSDSMVGGRKFRTFNVMDDCTREALAVLFPTFRSFESWHEQLTLDRAWPEKANFTETHIVKAVQEHEGGRKADDIYRSEAFPQQRFTIYLSSAGQLVQAAPHKPGVHSARQTHEIGLCRTLQRILQKGAVACLRVHQSHGSATESRGMAPGLHHQTIPRIT